MNQLPSSALTSRLTGARLASTGVHRPEILVLEPARQVGKRPADIGRMS